MQSVSTGDGGGEWWCLICNSEENERWRNGIGGGYGGYGGYSEWPRV